MNINTKALSTLMLFLLSSSSIVFAQYDSNVDYNASVEIKTTISSLEKQLHDMELRQKRLEIMTPLLKKYGIRGLLFGIAIPTLAYFIGPRDQFGLASFPTDLCYGSGFILSYLGAMGMFVSLMNNFDMQALKEEIKLTKEKIKNLS